MASTVSATGEPAAADPRDARIRDLEGQVAILTNIATALVNRGGGDVVLTKAELTALDHRFATVQDKATGDVRVLAKKRDNASSALTAEQLRQNRLAEEVALPKAGAIIRPPTGLIIP